MTTRTTAIFNHGVLRPMQPLQLAEGEIMEITFLTKSRPPRESTDDPIIAQMHSVKTLQELFAIANAVPGDEDGYDVLQALDQNRAFSGDSRRFTPAGE